MNIFLIIKTKKMSNNNLLKGSIIASALIAAAGFNANANGFSYNNLGSGQSVRTSLLGKTADSKTIELTCASDSAKKANDGKCGASKKAAPVKKGKDGKCGEGKCGATKKS
jgi:uncharacterized low-complexity protein